MQGKKRFKQYLKAYYEIFLVSKNDYFSGKLLDIRYLLTSNIYYWSLFFFLKDVFRRIKIYSS